MKDIFKQWLKYITIAFVGMLIGSFIGYTFDFPYIFGLAGGGESNSMYVNAGYFTTVLCIIGAILGVILYKKPILQTISFNRIMIVMACSITAYILAYPIGWFALFLFTLLYCSITNTPLIQF